MPQTPFPLPRSFRAFFAHARLKKITLIRGTPLLFSRSSNMMLALESTSENLKQKQHQGIVSRVTRSREHEERQPIRQDHCISKNNEWRFMKRRKMDKIITKIRHYRET
jgi:hypothetical protein